MQIQELNHQLVNCLNEWDPFKLGAGNYDTEIADIVQAVYELNDIEELGHRIQAVFEFSFEEIIPIEQCKKTAKILLALKGSSACSL